MSDARLASVPHERSVVAARDHYNEVYRHRYRLRPLRPHDQIAEPDDWSEFNLEHGFEDPACALIARCVVAVTRRASIGTLVDGRLAHHALRSHWHERATDGALVLVFNPAGGLDNLDDAIRRFKEFAKERVQRAVAETAVAEQPTDYARAVFVEPDSWEAVFDGTEAPPGVLLPPNEYLPSRLVHEAAYIFGVKDDTIRKWRAIHAGDRSKGRGQPRK